MSRRCCNIKIYAFFAPSIAPRSKFFAFSRVESESIDVIGGGPATDPDYVVVLEEHLITFDLILQNIMNASMKYSIVWISYIHGPNKTLIDNLNHRGKSDHTGIVKKCTLVHVSERSRS